MHTFYFPLSDSFAGGPNPKQPRTRTGELSQRLKELEVVNAITVAAASTLEMRKLLTLTGEKISEAFNHRPVLIALCDTSNKLILTPYWNVQGKLLIAPPLPIGAGLTSHVLRQRTPLLIDENLLEHATTLNADFSMAPAYGLPKSWVGVPMVVRDQAIGMIGVQDLEREHAFSPGDIRLLETIAASVAISIQNTQLYELAQHELAERKRAEAQANERADQMAAIYAIGRAITNQLELDSVLTTLRIRCQQIEPLIDVFSVALFDKYTETFNFLQFYDRGIQRTLKPRHIHQKKGGVTAQVIKTRKTIYIPDVLQPRSEIDAAAMHTSKEQARSYLGIPLRVGETIIGVLSGQSYQPDAFTPQRIELLETIAVQAAIALQNAKLFEETNRRASELSILYDIGLTLSRAIEPERVMRNLFEKCRHVLPMDAFYIALYNEETHMLWFPLFWDDGTYLDITAHDIRTNPGLSGRVIQMQKTLYLPDLLAPGVQEKYQVILEEGTPTHSYVGVPMIMHETVIGLISMQTKAIGAYTPEHIRLLELIANQAAIAVENSRLYIKAQEELETRRAAQNSLELANRELQTQLAQVEALQEKLREQALRDPLTGLHNRRYLNEQLAKMLLNARARHKRFCVIMLDIDHFKEFNDTYTHLTGDLLLQSLAALLEQRVRPTDIVCRFGGEEFILVLPDASLDIAAYRAEELRALFAQNRITFQNQQLGRTISLGVAGYPEHGATVEELVMSADKALYIAKENGRNQVAVWG